MNYLTLASLSALLLVSAACGPRRTCCPTKCSTYAADYCEAPNTKKVTYVQPAHVEASAQDVAPEDLSADYTPSNDELNFIEEQDASQGFSEDLGLEDMDLGLELDEPMVK